MTVDVIIACWNRADTILGAIRSALDQPEVHQVIVVDDGSTDGSAELAETLGGDDARLVVLRQAHNQGPSAARNRALDAATAEWVAVLDADDFLLPGRFGAVLTHADDADFLADDLLQVPASHPSPDLATPLLGVTADWWPYVDLARFVRGNIPRSGQKRREMGFLKPLMRRSFIEAHGLRYHSGLRLGEDFIFYARALAAGARFRLLPAAGYVAVMREDSLSGQHGLRDLEALLAQSEVFLADPGLARPDRRALLQHCLHVRKKMAWLQMITAVKARNRRLFLAGFRAPPQVVGHVIGCLLDQVRRRGMAFIGRCVRGAVPRAAPLVETPKAADRPERECVKIGLTKEMRRI